MQFILTDLQKEIKENAEKLLSEKIDNLENYKDLKKKYGVIIDAKNRKVDDVATEKERALKQS